MLNGRFYDFLICVFRGESQARYCPGILWGFYLKQIGIEEPGGLLGCAHGVACSGVDNNKGSRW